MRHPHSLENIPPPEPDPLLERLSEVLQTTSPKVNTWFRSQIESSLAQIPFLEASLKPVQSTPKETTSNRLLTPPLCQ